MLLFWAVALQGRMGPWQGQRRTVDRRPDQQPAEETQGIDQIDRCGLSANQVDTGPRGYSAAKLSLHLSDSASVSDEWNRSGRTNAKTELKEEPRTGCAMLPVHR